MLLDFSMCSYMDSNIAVLWRTPLMHDLRLQFMWYSISVCYIKNQFFKWMFIRMNWFKKISQQHVIGLDLVCTSISLCSVHSCWTIFQSFEIFSKRNCGWTREGDWLITVTVNLRLHDLHEWLFELKAHKDH